MITINSQIFPLSPSFSSYFVLFRGPHNAQRILHTFGWRQTSVTQLDFCKQWQVQVWCIQVPGMFSIGIHQVAVIGK